jgi:hypothetical protein
MADMEKNKVIQALCEIMHYYLSAHIVDNLDYFDKDVMMAAEEIWEKLIDGKGTSNTN